MKQQFIMGEIEEVNNLELWNKVEKTNPKYTKNAKVGGNAITSISPQYQIMMVTEQFGIYGKSWGFKDIELDYSLVDKKFFKDKTEGSYPNVKVIGKEEVNMGMVIFKATFFFPDGELPIINSISLFTNNAMSKLDDQFAKKVETDTLTKAISKLGFNADIFMGKFDDVRYLNELKEEFGQGDPVLKSIKEAKSIDELKKIYIENEKLFLEGSKVLETFNKRKKELKSVEKPAEKSVEQSHLELLINLINSTKSVDELTKIHEKEKKFQDNQQFMKALIERKTALNKLFIGKK